MEENFSYDRIAYPKKLFMQTHPEHLATLAVFFGMKPPPIENCRVLELGCGDGNSLLAHAFNLPNAHFVGVDLAENHIAKAKKSAEELSLKNIEFHQLDVMKMTVEDFGKFDYITAHGLFSWVPEFAREKILSLCNEMLSPNGVGYISFNAFPGARQRQMVGDVAKYFTRTISEPNEKVENAVKFLDFLTENSGEAKVYQSVLKNELERFLKLDASEIFHDDLAEINQPFYFYKFAELLEKNDLQFLAEADLHAMFTGGLSTEASEFINSLADIIEREQYIDFFRGHTFRRVLFCRKEIELNRRIEPSILEKFLFNSQIRPASENFDFVSTKFETFVGVKGDSIEIDQPLTKAALFYLGQIWARSVSFFEMIETARELLVARGYQTADWQTEFETASEVILQICCRTNLIKIHLRHSQAATVLSEKPKISDFARWQLRDSVELLTLYNISISFEDDFTRHLLYLLDGIRNRLDLLTEMLHFVESSKEIQDKEIFLSAIPDRLEMILEQLLRVGMFGK
ncbi:MAG: class I SAM-dependent methyltransferase [Pyrinomonadaceae bacterium]